MAINDSGTRDQYVATAAQIIFPYTFEIFDKDDIAVEQNGTLLTEGTHYTVSGVGVDAGGNVTIAATDIDNGSTDACGVLSTSIDVTDFTCGQQSTSLINHPELRI